jgi:hypothetical protein
MTKTLRNIARHPCRIAGALLLVTVTGGATQVLAQGAGASGTTHTLAAVTNLSTAVEGAVKVTFSCDDATGAFTFKASNIQVIEDDHATRWPVLQLAWNVTSTAGSAGGGPFLKQNKTNGLFAVKQTGTLSDVQSCAAGATFYLNDATGYGWLSYQATLT